jgi:dethiobiotin synthetase
MQARCIFITGTGTAVGKTVIAAGLLRWFRGQGLDAVPMKPVETGLDEAGAPSDLQFCLDASGLNPTAEDLADMQPYQYAPACSPHLAGRLANRYPQLDTILACAQRLAQRHELVVIEGAGGLLVPLNESQTMLDLIVAGRFDVILVAHSGLGTINHTLLSIEALRSHGAKLLGVVFNAAAPVAQADRFIHIDNPATIERFGKVNILGCVPRLDGDDPQRPWRWDLFDRHMGSLADVVKGL